MGIFGFFKKNETQATSSKAEVNMPREIIEQDRARYQIDDVTIEIPKSWEPYEENGRFKANNKSGSIELSFKYFVVGRDKYPNSKSFLLKTTSNIINDIIINGGYLQQEDTITKDNYVYSSFLVDNSENHFHCWFFKDFENDFLFFDLILKESGNWNANTKMLLFEIVESIQVEE